MAFRIFDYPGSQDIDDALKGINLSANTACVLVYDVTSKFFDLSREGVRSSWRRHRLLRVCEGHN